MAARVTASEIQENFGLWYDRSLHEPVPITKHGRESADLVSAETFRELWPSYRRDLGVQELSGSEMAMIAAADVPDERAYDVADLDRTPTPDGPLEGTARQTGAR